MRHPDLGGGYCYLASKHRLVINNLLKVEIVPTNRSSVTTSETENPDLFWVVRGAGVSFGIVTKFMYRAYEQEGLVWGGLLTLTPCSKLNS